MQRLLPRFLLLFTLLLAFAIYRPGLNGPFVFDDGLNVVSNQHLRIQDFSLSSLSEAAFSSSAGLFQRPISMLSFAVNFYLQPDSLAPYPFKLTNLLVHLLNGLMVFALTRMLLCFYRARWQPKLSSIYPEWLALAVAAAWLLHPLNLTSVLYVVQRMNSLAALLTLIGLLLYVWGRIRVLSRKTGGILAILVGVFIFTPLAMLCKENGVLLPAFVFAAELTLFKFETPEPVERRFLIGIFISCIALPLLIFLSYVVLNPGWLLGGYAIRDFGMSERLMTEARVVWLYLRLIVFPSTSEMGVFHDDFAVSRQIFDPLSTLPAVLGISALFVSVWLLRKRCSLMAFGILFFLVGHSLESTFLPLELVHEHRNYLPSFGILLAFFHLLLELPSTTNVKVVGRFVAILLIALFAADTYSRVNAWANPFVLWQSEVDHHPNSPRTNNEMGDLYAQYVTTDRLATETHYVLSKYYYEQAIVLQRNNVNGLFGLINLSVSHGKPVEKFWLMDLIDRLEHEALPANLNDKLISLAACRLQESCPVREDEVVTLLNAPLRNPTVVGNQKALVYTALTFYLINVAHDYSAALQAISHSIELAPQELEYRLTLVNFLMALQRQDEARRQLDMLKEVDRKRSRMRDIELLEKQLLKDS